MKFLKKFETQGDYKTYTERQDYELPNVCLVEGEVIFNNDKIPFYVEAVDDLVIYPTTSWFLYSYDNENWQALTTSASTSAVHVAGRKIFIKASGYSVSSSSGIGILRFQGQCKVGGNIRTILNEKYHDDTVALMSSQFKTFFQNATSLVSARDLIISGPLGSYCFYQTFYGCTALVDAPTILSTEFYNSYQVFYQTFYGCTALIAAPVIRIASASLSSTKTFVSMFNGCGALNYIKTWINSLPMSSSGSFSSWLTGVAAYGVFIINADAESNWETEIMPAGWEKKLCDIDTNITFIKFKIDSASYQADDEMTWEAWVDSDYNTAGLTSDGTNIISDAGTLMLGDVAVLATDLVKCIIGTDYTIGTVTESTSAE